MDPQKLWNVKQETLRNALRAFGFSDKDILYLCRKYNVHPDDITQTPKAFDVINQILTHYNP